MSKRLYVGGLSYQTTDAVLQSAFAQAGTVESATVVLDRMTGRSRGFGFVEMATDEEADAAIKMWDGQELDGRRVRVNIAMERGEGGGARISTRGAGRRQDYGGGDRNRRMW
ncbi:MAG: hypothetical protein G01um101466_132 [Parcubacteria group bacterium Gr01-1014_66]|nr:MAG: hypothetical protein G01um101466_132 [Parcubacteria group bacterium Gr01-1014_66]